MKILNLCLFIILALQFSLSGQQQLIVLKQAESAESEKDYAKAKRIYKNMIANASVELDTTMAYAFINLGHLYLFEDQKDSSMYFYNKGLEYHMERNDSWRSRYFLLAMAETSSFQRDYVEEKKYLFRAYDEFDEKDDQTMRALSSLGNIFINQGKLDSAEYFLDLCESLSDSIGKHSYNLYLNKGFLSQKKGNYVESIDNYLKSIEYYTTEEFVDKSPLFVANNYIAISRLYLKLDDFDNTLKYITKAEKIGIEEGFKTIEKRVLQEKGMLFLSRKETLDSALIYFKNYLEKIENTKKKSTLHSTHNFLARTYLELGEIPNAEKHLELSYPFFLSLTSIFQRARYYEVKGRLAMKKNKPRDAIGNFHEFRKLSKESAFEANILKGYKLLAQAYQLKGDHENAYKYLDTFQTRTTAKNHLQRDQIIYNLDGKFQKAKQDLEISNLNNENYEKDLKIGNKNNQLLLGGMGLLLLSVVGFGLYFLYRNKKRSNKLLSDKNKIIETSLSDKELLLKEIHHRVKNNLQVVSSLLGLQSEYITDESALSAINEGRNRVRSMSLIHQNLYKEDNLRGINVKSYFEKLISGLFDTYNISSDRISLKLSVQELDLDVDTIVPLGLITNELVSNALKHGFRKKQEGVIEVALHEIDGALELVVKDDGDGMDKEISEDIQSFGYQMIYAFKQKLNATLDIKVNKGTQIKLSIKDYEVV